MKAVEKLDGWCFSSAQFLEFPVSIGFDIVVDGKEIMVQFAKYGPNAERM